jgi:L-rhamnose mutarotase
MEIIKKGYMGFSEGMMIGQARGRVSQTGFREVDWNKAKEYIEENKGNIVSVSAGLAEDWEYTHDEVWNEEEGYIKECDVYACSNWATPSIEVEFSNGSNIMFECWHYGANSDSRFE